MHLLLLLLPSVVIQILHDLISFNSNLELLVTELSDLFHYLTDWKVLVEFQCAHNIFQGMDLCLVFNNFQVMRGLSLTEAE